MYKVKIAVVLLCVALVGGAASAAPGSSGPISKGDVLYVEVYRVPELSQNYLVQQDGTIMMPYNIGSISVGGLSEAAALAIVTQSVQKVMHRPRVTLTRSNMGFIPVGEGRSSQMMLEIIPLNNSNAETMSAVLQGMTSPGGRISYDPDTNSLLITDMPEVIENVKSSLARLDNMQAQMTQVRIETKIAEVREGALKQMGIQWSFQGDHMSGGWASPATTLPGLRNLHGNFSPLANENVSQSNYNGNGNSFGREFVDNPFTQRLNLPVIAPMPGQAFFGFGSGSLDLAVLIDALESNQQAKVLANPTLLTVNHKTAEIKMVDELPFQELGREITGAERFSVRFMEVGIKLLVTPHVLKDDIGDYIKLELRPEVSFLSGISNGVPIRSVRSSATVANVRDGQTLVIGGILSEDEQDIVTKMPGLSRIPILGNLFKHKEKTKFRSELMIFVTPTIHYRPEEITWDKMTDLSEGIRNSSLLANEETRRKARKD